jgi:pimeloyl-ACP methyl ester carboxylesterase
MSKTFDTAQDWRTVELSAGPIRYRDTGAGEPLVFVHGALANAELWGNALPDVERSARCIAVDWPLGSHRLPMRPDADLSPPALADLIVEFCDHLGLEKATFIGNDTGGALCQLVAARYPERVSRLVLTPCDAYENFPPPKLFRLLNLAGRIPGGLWEVGQTMRWRWTHRLPFTFGRLARHRIDPELLKQWFEPLRTTRGVRRDFKKLLRTLSSEYTLGAVDRLRNLQAPALIVWSREDPVFPFAHGERLAADLPDARLVVVEDSYGFVPLDQPRRLVDLIAGFLRETSRTAR